MLTMAMVMLAAMGSKRVVLVTMPICIGIVTSEPLDLTVNTAEHGLPFALRPAVTYAC